jgi:hypothetical protein
MRSPVAQAIAAGTNDKSAMRVEALRYARSCVDACDAAGVEYDEDTLSNNIESNFPELSLDDCEGVASLALAGL